MGGSKTNGENLKQIQGDINNENNMRCFVSFVHRTTLHDLVMVQQSWPGKHKVRRKHWRRW